MATKKRSSTETGDDGRLAGATIAVDARLVGYAAGIAQYTIQLLRALVELGGGERYVVLQRRRAGRPILHGGRVETRWSLTPPHHRLERWTLPVELWRPGRRPALLHSPDHVAPAWGPWSSVVTLHDLAFLLFPDTHTPESRAYYAAAGPSVRRARRVIAVSHATAADAVRLLGVDPARIRVIHEAASPACWPRPRSALAPVATRLGLDLDRPYVLFVGTLEPRKNLPLLLRAFSRARKEADLQLVVAGRRGWLAEPIFATVDRLGLEGSVRFIGQQDEETLAVLYSHAAVVAVPSLYEGFGLVPLEAMACGAPVVASRVGPLPEVVGDGALLLSPHEESAWADALAQIVAEPARAAALRARGRARAAQFTWERAARATRDTYREALASA